MDKIKLLIIKNPFEPKQNREEWFLSYMPGEPISTYVKTALAIISPEEEIYVGYNGGVIEGDKLNELYPVPGGTYAVFPVVAGGDDSGKQILSTLLSIGLFVFSMGIGNLVQYGAMSGAAAAGGMAGWGFGAYAAAMGAQLAGGLLLSALTPHPKMQQQESATYHGWGIGTQLNPGGPIQTTFGTVRVGGTLIARHVTSDGNKQYLNMLFSGGEGPVDYHIDQDTGEVVVDGIKNIQINGNPLENYQDIEVFLRAGLNDQTVIPNFSDSFIEQGLSYELQLLANDDDWSQASIHQTESDGAEGLEVSLYFPGGLFKTGKNGKYEDAKILVRAQYRQQVDSETWSDWVDWKVPSYSRIEATENGTNGFQIYGSDLTNKFYAGREINLMLGYNRKVATVVSSSYYPGGQGGQPGGTIVTVNLETDSIRYVELQKGIGDFEIYEAMNSSFRRAFRLDNLLMGRYEVRMKCIYKSGTSTQYSTHVMWNGLTSIVYDDFEHPNMVLVGIRALSTDQLSGGDLQVTWEQTRSNVIIWNPLTEEYEERPANNPSWASYDILHGVRKLKNINTDEWEYEIRGAKTSRNDFQDFSLWADFCTEKGLHCNYYVDAISDLWSALKPIGEIGRGQVILRGTKFGAMCDAPSEPVYTFTCSNMLEPGFSMEYLPETERANAIEIKFRDKERNYDWHTIMVYSDGWDDPLTVSNPVQIELKACTDYEEAWKHGRYRLRVNHNLIRTGSWSVDVEGLPCSVGDVVALQNDITKWGVGGRLKEITANTLTLDKTVEFVAGKPYEVKTKVSSDANILRTVVNPSPSFSRSSTAYKRDNSEVASGLPRYETLYGDQVLVEETTNLLPRIQDWIASGTTGYEILDDYHIQINANNRYFRYYAPVFAGQVYTYSIGESNGYAYFYWCDSAKNRISGSMSATATSPRTATAPSGAAYVEVVLHSVDYALPVIFSEWQFEQKDHVTPFTIGYRPEQRNELPFGKGIMVEEGTTNLIPVDKQNFEGWSAMNGATVTISQNQSVPEWGATDATRIQTSGGTTQHKYGSSVSISVSEGQSFTESVLVKNTGINPVTITNGITIVGIPVVYPGEEKELVFTNSAAGTFTLRFATVAGRATDSLDFIAWRPKIEAKAYSTSFHPTTRQPEAVSIKHGLTPEEGTIEGIFEVNDLSKRQLAGQYPRIFGLPIVGNNDRGIGFRHAPTSANWWFQIGDADGSDTVNISDSLMPNGFYRYRVTWTSALARIELYSLATKQRVATASIANPKLPSAFAENLNIGGTGTAATACSNTIHADIRCSSIARTDTEYGLDKPLPVDEWTTVKVGFDESLDTGAQVITVSTPFTEDTILASESGLTQFIVEGDMTAKFVINSEIVLEYGYEKTKVDKVVFSSFDGENTNIQCIGPVPSDLYAVRYAFTMPRTYDLYQFGEVGKLYYRFRLLSTERDGELRRKLNALEYIPEVYDDSTDIPPPIDYTEWERTIALSVTEHVDPLSGTVYLDLMWTPPRKEYYGARIELDGQRVGEVDISRTSFSIPIESLREYLIRVVTKDYFGNDYASAEQNYTIEGETAPSDIIGLTSYFEGETLNLTWVALDDVRPILYEVRKGISWDAAQVLGRTSMNKWTTIGDGTYWVRAYYRAKYSPNPVSVYIEGSTEFTNVVANFDERATGWSGTLTDAAIIEDTIQLIGSGLVDDIENVDGIVSWDQYGGAPEVGYYEIPSEHVVNIGTAAACFITATHTAETPEGTAIAIQINVAGNDDPLTP